MNESTVKPIVAINTRHWIPGKMEGVGRFEMNIAVQLSLQHPEVDFHWLFDRKPPINIAVPSNVTLHSIMPQARHPLLIKWWYNVSIPRLLRKIKADVFLSADNIASLRAPCRTITVIHDIYFEHNSESFPRRYLKFYRKNTPKFLGKTDKIITVSEFSKRDIISKYGITEEKISVIPNGVMSHFKPLKDEQKDEIRNRLSRGKPYFFVLGSIHPRKNVDKTIEAFLLFRQKTKCTYPLVISGRPLWKNGGGLSRLIPPSDDVVFTGYCTDEELGNLMASAFAILFFSKFEGFGVPIIEAFQSGIPVAASNVSALPEIAGNAALMADPESVDSMSGAIELLWKDELLRKSLIEKGFERAKSFSWGKSAEILWAEIKILLKKQSQG